jgi:transitional endoplasmic reticulum ATPase
MDRPRPRGAPWSALAQRRGRGRLWDSRRRRPSTHPAEKLAALWTLRVLLADPTLDRHDHFAACLPQETAEVIGLPELAVPRPAGKTPPPPLRKALEKRLRQVEADPVEPKEDFPRNMGLLARVLGLTPLERDLVAFSVVMQGVEGLASLFRSVGPDGLGDICRSAAVALAASEADLRRALRKDGVLRSTGLVSLDLSPPVHLAFQAMPDLSELLLSGRRTARAIMRQFLREAPATRLDLKSFAHVADDARTLVRLVSGALRRRVRGVNVLLHGAPGTGKTELVRVVAKEVGARLFEVADEQEDEYDSTRFSVERLSLCALAQQVLARAPRTLLLFDEVEDVFGVHWQGSLGLMRHTSGHKSWTHRLIEQAPVPTFWLCNEIRQIDPATLRRFDLVVELRVPPSTVRVRMLHDALGTTKVDQALVGRLATDERLTPAHVVRAVRTTRLMGAREASDATQALSHVLGRNLDAQGPARAQPTVQLVCGPYELGLVNASADLAQITDAIVREKRATVCLYGPPGTGKTAWAKHLAERMGAPMKAARASDLLDCYVGGTEKNIAALFAGARDERAVLFLDEANSFLQDRAHAMRSWEVTQVNELLVQMEAFEGVFVCATNLVDSIDRASLRRFALKIEFRALRPQSRWTMLLRVAPSAEGDREVRAMLDRLDGLTPGDFAAVARQARLAGAEGDARAIVGMLERELVLRKRGAGGPIGFGP